MITSHTQHHVDRETMKSCHLQTTYNFESEIQTYVKLGSNSTIDNPHHKDPKSLPFQVHRQLLLKLPDTENHNFKRRSILLLKFSNSLNVLSLYHIKSDSLISILTSEAASSVVMNYILQYFQLTLVCSGLSLSPLICSQFLYLFSGILNYRHINLIYLFLIGYL